jgi:hypothetical protein
MTIVTLRSRWRLTVMLRKPYGSVMVPSPVLVPVPRCLSPAASHPDQYRPGTDSTVPSGTGTETGTGTGVEWPIAVEGRRRIRSDRS